MICVVPLACSQGCTGGGEYQGTLACSEAGSIPASGMTCQRTFPPEPAGSTSSVARPSRRIVSGDDAETLAHSSVACRVAKNLADVRLRVETAAPSHRLHSIPRKRAHHDLGAPVSASESPLIQTLARQLLTGEAKAAIMDLGRCDTRKQAGLPKFNRRLSWPNRPGSAPARRP